MKQFAKVLSWVWLALSVVAPVWGGPVLMNEIMYHPISENTLEEYIELFNTGTNTVNLAGWRFVTGVHFTFPDVTIAPGAFLVVAANEAAFTNKYPGVKNYVAGWDGVLSNSGQLIELTDAQGQQHDSVRYADDGDWAIRVRDTVDFGHAGWIWRANHDGFGKSLELINPALPNKYGQNWSASGVMNGTPGGPNSVARTNIPPIIFDVQHFPLVPRSTDPVTITARILDEQKDGVAVVVHHRLDGVTIFAVTPMFDDGLHGDGIAGDGVYGAVRPPGANNSIVEFYIEARDVGGNTRTWPAAVREDDGSFAQKLNALYQVDDSPNYSGNQPVYRLILTAADHAELKQINRNSPPATSPTMDQTRSHATFNSTFISFDGTGTELRYLVGVRNRGNGSRGRLPQSYKVDFRQDQLWKKTAAINLNTQYSYAQIAGSAIFRRSGVAAAEARPAQVRVNNANLCAPDAATSGSPIYGYYAHLEAWENELAARHFPNDSSGNIYRGIRLVPPGANLSYQGESPALYRENYFKFSNSSADDWTDLIELTRVLNNAPDTNYTAEVNRVIDVKEWMRYFAISTLIDNNETCLSNGDGDDYYLYRGIVDPRFKVLPYDLDTIMGQGDTPGSVTASLFRMAEINPATGGFSPAMNRFVKWPDFAPIYYQSLKQLIDTTFSAEQLNPLLDQTLAGIVPDSTIARMKSFAAQRDAYVLSQMPLSLSAASDLPLLNGYPHTTIPTVALSGLANVIDTRSVLVNGQPAVWSAWDGNWSIGGVPLRPGINRVLVQSLDASRRAFAETNIDIWNDDGNVQTTGGLITANTTWTVTGGPYQVTTNLTVASGATLTVEPGTTVYFSAGVNVTVADGGRLLAEGATNAPIRFARAPGDTASWGRLTINGSVGSPETRIAYAYFDGNGSTCIEVAGGTLYLDHTTFGTTTHQYVSLDNSSFLISNCIFPTSTAPFELLHGTGGIKPGGRGIVRECFFGSTSGYNDIMDFTGGNRDLNQPIIQCYNNVFVGASDDMLDLDGTDAWIEGNIFLHAHKDGPPDSSSAISGGDDGGNTSELTIIGNLFFDCDQAATAKQGNFFTLLNNTIVRTTRSGGLDTASGVVNVRDFPDGGQPTAIGKGFYLEGNVIVDAEQLVRNYDSLQTSVTFNNNILPFAWSGPGNGNSVVDPLLKHIPQLSETLFTTWEQAQVLRDWFSLLPGSPALRTGPNGRDMGGVAPLGAYLTGAPAGTNNQTTATLTVGINRKDGGIPTAGFPEGSGYSHYKWRLDGGAWSVEMPIATPISLTGLGNGPHRVEIVGKRDSGSYQDDPAFGPEAVITASRTWTVDTNSIPPAGSGLVINEILAKNDSILPRGASYPDLIELFNNGDSARDLNGLGLTDDAASKYKFTFPAGTMLAPGGFLLIYADTASGASELHSGFTLKQSGGALYLFDKTANGGGLLDSVAFGLQLPDLSVGRLADGTWGLTSPTFGAQNVAYPLGDARRLRINEWLADARATFNSGFIELYNPNPAPVSLVGMYLTDNPVGAPTNYVIAPLSFIPAGGFAVFKTDQRPDKGADHLNFTLLPEQGEIGLFGANGDEIDLVLYRSQVPDISEGRSPTGANTFAAFTQPTPGAGNPGIISNTNVTSVTFDLITISNNWKYYDSGDAGASWNTIAFDDSAWPSGPALLYHEPDSLPAPKNTALTLGKTAYYFRTHFGFETNSAGVTLKTTSVIDDGAIIYLNGVEVYRLAMSNGSVSYSTLANRTVGDAVYEGPFEIPAASLVQGDNVLAVEVHQVNATSSDIVFGMTLMASFLITNNSSAIKLPVVLNEVLADSATLTNAAGVVTDWIELYNPNTNAVDLADMSLSDDSTTPRKWIFPPGSNIPAQGFLTIGFNGGGPVSATNTGFGLNSNSGAVYLFDTAGQGGALVDAVTYGLQVADYSIGRIPSGTGPWALNVPTPTAANVATSLGDSSFLRINEWMADPSAGEDWFEIGNLDARPVELSGLFLTDDLNNRTQNLIPALSFVGSGASGYVKFDADGAPGNGADHVNFKLSAKGESIGLFAANGVALDSITFGPQQVDVSQGRLPDGTTNIVSFPTTATPGEGNYLPLTNVVINEVLTHTDPPLEDAVELYNPASSPVDISGWYLSNTPDNLKKFRIPGGIVIPAGGYKVFYEYEFNPDPDSSNSFTMNSAHGDDMNISSADSTGKLNGYRARQKFGAAENGVSFGRYATSVGVDFVAMSQRTFGVDNPATLAAFRTGKGNPNAYPKVGPVVLSEIMFHPPDIGGTNGTDNTLDEFIELRNITADLALLYDPAAVTNTWKIDGGISYTFPMNVSLPPGGFLLLVNFNPIANPPQLAAFRSKYGVSTAVPIYGPYSGKLNNSGDRIDLLKPDPPQLPPHPDAGFVPYVLVEQVRYSAAAPWPAGADGSGLSLQRKSATEYGNDPVNWRTGAPTAGRDSASDLADSDGDGLPDNWEIANGLRSDSSLGDDGASGDPDRDGMTNLQEYLSGTDPKNAGSALRFEDVNWIGTGFKLSFTAVAGKSYTIQYRDSLSAGGWNKLRDVDAQSVTTPVETTDTAVQGSNGRYYRLVTPLLP